jgi:hypothetical protein
MDLLDNEIQLMRRVAAVDEVGALAGFEVPVRELVEIARLEFDRRRIRAVPDASPLKVAVEHFAGLQDGITRAFDALEWLRAASAVAMPAALLRRSSSPAAADEFARLKALTNRAAGPLGVYDGQVEMLGSKLGPVVYARSEPGVVSEEVAALLERKEELRELVGLSSMSCSGRRQRRPRCGKRSGSFSVGEIQRKRSRFLSWRPNGRN